MITTDPTTSPTGQNSKTLDGARILLVDDAPEIAALFATILKREGAEVWVVDNGQSTIALHRDIYDTGQPLELVILDWMMPDISGLDLARFIRARDQQVKIAFLTAYHDLIGLEQIEEVRAELWAKPIGIQALVSHVSQALEKA